MQMSQDQLNALLSALKSNQALKEELERAASLDAAVDLANREGFEVSKQDWFNYQNSATELNDSQLEALAGGAKVDGNPDSKRNTDKCDCG